MAVAEAPATSSTRTPEGVPPVIGCWFWHEREFEPEGYRAYLDLVHRHATYNWLTTSLRVPEKEVTDAAVKAQIRRAAEYARQRGIGMVMDLDVRLARAAFRREYPDELQEMLRLREVELPDSGEVVCRIGSEVLSDHYTFRATPYLSLSGRLVRVYAYRRGPQGLEPETVQDITESRCRVESATAEEVRVALAGGPSVRGQWACVMVAFTHFTPDVFAPHLLEFQRRLLEQYADVPLAGACKDEWGFPPCFDGCPAHNDFWYSRFLAAEYARRTGGRDLIRDSLLMFLGERGRDRERQRAINHYMEMAWQRCGAIEADFYRATKAVFGPAAVVGTHPTWWPHPDLREFKKNGLDWWVARRDWAQTDEVTPFCVRTALAKKWRSPLWYNMFYSSSVADYQRSLWTHALGGGRINFHPIYPAAPPGGGGQEPLLAGGLTRGDCRIRLLNFISKSPLDCPVAVVFGHACAMNWAGPAYDDVGLAVADGLWQAGFPADLIPADEIRSGALKIGRDGAVRYGPQRYAAVVLYHPEFEGPKTAEFFRRAARGPTALYRVGGWTRDFEGRPFDGEAALPAGMVACPEAAAAVAAVVAHLRQQGIAPQTPATETIGWDRPTVSPPPAGHCRLLDGTYLLLAGAQDVAGDPIQATFSVDGHPIEVKACGVVGVRLTKGGRLQALAAGGLERFRGGGWELTLEQPVDLAVWRDARGRLQGVLQGWEGTVPPPLAALTGRWLRLAVPVPLGPKEGP